MSIIRFSIVAAMTTKRGIGLNGGLPWRIKQDMKFFVDLTTTTTDSEKQNAVIIGKNTYFSFPEKFRPLKNRINFIISHDKELREKHNIPDSVYICSSVDEALILMQEEELKRKIENIFVIGGGQIYKKAINLPECEKLYLTEVDADISCDTFFPEIPLAYKKTKESETFEENNFKFRFAEYTRLPMTFLPPYRTSLQEHEELQYLNLIRYILDHGALRTDRTNTGTRSVFGTQMRFLLANGVIPLLTTKKVFWRGIVEELLWFIRGCTDGRVLKEKNIHIWDGNGTRSFLDSVGLTQNEEDDLGPIYGFQWRHFGAAYEGRDKDYSNQGVDQLKEVIHLLKTDPYNRRIILSAWNPADLRKMALPPCHVMSQFYVQNGYLSCQMYQRSADMGLGVPFNIASYSLLTILLAHITGLKPGEFVHSIGDTHVYVNHEEALLQQIEREPRPFPTLRITKQSENIEEYTFADFELVGYNPHETLKMKMAIWSVCLNQWFI
ncbi:Thymidylate synthase [Blastocystis hominis]|uniref:Bifunctional dihydrofolate reductase-thymidylate synthase n=1 Tax=Blastocystis hominis TaxID=12968 RepID=D8LWN8_BLAHO|nr:Thymidylate synthase [Blastocystis hominis]CBK20227.2 Thymidylate synthase [Blastocystis hominis]|eukprot:XP_012894275.1 Thymidylate synthase [Blastocystis hominis]